MTKTGRKHAACMTDTMGSWTKGSKSAEKNSPERAKVSYHTSKTRDVKCRCEDVYFILC